MDFLEVRKKAKARAGAAAPATGAPAMPPAPPPEPVVATAPPLPPDLPPASEPLIAGAERVEAELAARLQELPPADDAPRFTTWRPGDGAPPIPLAEREPPPPPRADEDPPRAAFPEELRPGPVIRFLDAPEPPPAAPAPRRTVTLDDFFYRPDEDAPGLAALAVAPEAPAEPGSPQALDEYLTFRLGAEEYAIDIQRVREVVKSPPVTEVPRAPAHVLGVVTVRGEVVAVFDPRRRLALPGAPPPDGQGRIVIVDAGEGGCGLLVDAVSSVVRLPRGAIEPCPQGISGGAGDCLAGIGRDGDRLFTVLDLDALLRRTSGARHAGDGARHAR
jgi:purine-binding chemotaxis protein CheW